MNDITIIKTISKVHSIIIDLLILIFITFFSIYFTLHIGLKLDKVILPNLKIEQLYIKWDEKIVVDIDSIYITKSNTKGDFNLSSIDAPKILKKAQVLDSLFSEVSVKKIRFNDINATFRYKENAPGFLEIEGPALNVVTHINMNEHLIFLNIQQFQDRHTDTDLNGTLVVDLQEHRTYGNLDINISGIIPLNIKLLADRKSVQFNALPNAPVTKSLDPIIKLAKLPKLVEPWVADYLEGEALYIDYIKGRLEYDHPLSILDSLDVKAHYDNVSYIFAPGYEPAKAPRVDLEFKDRILYIYPRKATFYKQPGGTTWTKIDFTNPSNPLLSVDVDTTGKMTPHIKAWLEGYGIVLPFYQTKGLIKVKLALWIELEEIDITANGGFSTQKATFDFSNTAIKVKNVKVNLKNTDVDIYSLNASLLDNAINVDLSGRFNPVAEKGRFDIKVNHLVFKNKETHFNLDNSHKKLQFSYILQPEHDRLIIPRSFWHFNQQALTVESIVAPFAFSKLSGHLPTTLITLEHTAKAFASGPFSIKELTTHLTVDLLSFNKNELKLAQTVVPLQVSYDQGIKVESKAASRWKYNGTEFTINPSQVCYNNSIIDIHKAHFSLGTLLDTQLQGSYNTYDGSGKLILKQLHATLDETPLLAINKDIKIYLQKKENEHLLEVPIFNLKLKTHQQGWEMGIKNIHLLSSYSPLLQEYNITEGSVHLHATTKKKGIDVYGVIPYPYPILIINEEPLKKIHFNGTYNDGTLQLFLNNTIKVAINSKKLSVKADKVGVSLYPVFDYIHDHSHPEDTQAKGSEFLIDISATHSFLYINEARRAPADKLLLQYTENRLNAQLLHGEDGGAALEFNPDGELFIYGNHLNDQFMTQLAEFSDFKGGEVSFYMVGKPDKIKGVVRVKNTIVKDYKAVNNILAFMNTIPALVTFSVPDYNAKGMVITEGYAGFLYENDLLKINGFHVQGPEIKFNGLGTFDIKTKTVDIETSLITDATSNLSKIPLIGYILVGKEDETITTTVTLTGPMDDPKVKSTFAKDIGVGTFNILFRTLTFPVHYIQQAQKSLTTDKAVQRDSVKR